MGREIARIERASPAARALMLENLRSVSYECREHIVARWGLVSDDPVVFSRLQVARVRALARAGHYEANDTLKRLAATARIGAYQALPGEKPAPRRRLRQLALAALIEQRGCDAECLVLLDSISDPRDPVDQLILSQAFEREGERGRNVFDDLERALAVERGNRDLAFARALAHLRMIDGLADALLGDLIARRGAVPLTRGDNRRALDLALEAGYALERQDHPELRMPEGLRPPSMDPLFPPEELLRLVPESERSERLSVLMLELDAIAPDSDEKWNADYLGVQLAAWSLPSEAARVRDEIARWLFRGKRASSELENLVKAALRLDARAHEHRFALARRIVVAENTSGWISLAIREGLPWWEDAVLRRWLEARVFEERESALPSGRVFLELLRFYAADKHGELLWHRLSLRIARALEALPRALPKAFDEELLVLAATAPRYGQERRLRELAEHARELLMASNDGDSPRGVGVVDVSLAMVGR